jgi:hypothetical protein
MQWLSWIHIAPSNSTDTHSTEKAPHMNAKAYVSTFSKRTVRWILLTEWKSAGNVTFYDATSSHQLTPDRFARGNAYEPALCLLRSSDERHRLMNTKRLLISAFSPISAVVIPLFAGAQDSKEPGKSSDALKNPPAQSPRTNRDLAPTPPDREPGKTLDSIREPNPTATERQFTGRITSVNRSDNTITINDQTSGSQVLHIGETTRMKRGNTGASWDDLKVGENVQGMMRSDGIRAHASTVEIGK